jgi:hypothetical protein
MRGSALLGICILALMLISCGSSPNSGGGTNPPRPDFTISLDNSSISQQAGGAAVPFTISIAARNGFSEPVSIALSGLPSGVSSLPTAPFTIAAGSSQAISLQIPRTVTA